MHSRESHRLKPLATQFLYNHFIEMARTFIWTGRTLNRWSNNRWRELCALNIIQEWDISSDKYYLRFGIEEMGVSVFVCILAIIKSALDASNGKHSHNDDESTNERSEKGCHVTVNISNVYISAWRFAAHARNFSYTTYSQLIHL